MKGYDMEQLKELLEQRIAEFGGKRPPNGEYQILCPFHAENNPSCFVNLEKGFFHCFGCGESGSIEKLLKELNGEKILPSDKTSLEADKPQTPTIERKIEYDYRDEKERLVFKRLRVEFSDGKKIFYSLNPDGELIKNYQPLLLYNLPAVLKSDTVFFVEGEKCCDALVEYGFTSTTLPVGATSKINKEALRALLPLKGKTVYVMPDNDEQGLKYAKSIYKALNQIGANVEIIFVPDLGDKSDIADYLEFLRLQGLNKDEIKEQILILIKKDEGIEFDQIEPNPTGWSIPDWIPKGKITIIAGREGAGKTRLSLILATSKANGTPIFTADGFKEVQKGVVFYFSIEDEPSNLAYWVDAVGLKRSSNLRVFEIFDFWQIRNIISKHNPDLVIIDPCNYLIKGDLNSAKDVQIVLKPLVNLAKEKDISIVLTWHLNKSQTTDMGKAILGTSITTAMAKRLIVLEKQEDKSVVHFKKTKNTKPVAFVVDEGKFEWVSGEEFSEFNSNMPQGREIAELIRTSLKESENGLLLSSIKKLVETYEVSLTNLRKIKERYLKDVVSEPVKQDGKIKGWIWKFQSDSLGNVTLGQTLENQQFFQSDTKIKNIYEQEITNKKSLKINELQEQEKNHNENIINCHSGKSVENTGFSPERHLKNCHSGKMAKKSCNSLKNKDNQIKILNEFESFTLQKDKKVISIDTSWIDELEEVSEEELE